MQRIKEKEEKLNSLKKGNINFFKGLCLLAIIYIHMAQFDYGSNHILFLSRKLLYIFFIGSNGFFAIIYGYNMKETSVCDSLKKTFKSLIVPYLLTSVLVLVFFPIVHYLFFKWWPGAFSEDIKYFYTFIFGLSSYPGKIFGKIDVYEASVIYYLLALFIGGNITNIIIKIEKTQYKIILVILCLFISAFLAFNGFFYLSLCSGLGLVICCYIGYCLKNNKSIRKMSKLELLLLSLFILIIVSLYVNRFILPSGIMDLNFKNLIGYVLCIFFSPLSALFLVILASMLEISNRFSKKIKLIGVNTPFAMCAHGLELMCLPWYKWGDYFTNNNMIVIGIILEFIIRVAIVNILTILIKKLFFLVVRKMDNAKSY